MMYLVLGQTFIFLYKFSTKKIHKFSRKIAHRRSFQKNFQMWHLSSIMRIKHSSYVESVLVLQTQERTVMCLVLRATFAYFNINIQFE